MNLRNILALDDFEAPARRRLPRLIFGNIASHVERGQSVRANSAAFDRYAFLPRTLIDTSGRSTETELFGTTYSAPFGIPPVGGTLLACPDGDRVMARAAAQAGIPFVLSASSLTSLEKVFEAGRDPWFQVYLPGDREKVLGMVHRVAAAGYRVLVVTVDVPLIGNRENNIRVGFNMPMKPSLTMAGHLLARPRWLARWAGQLLAEGMPHFENMEAERGPPVVSRSLTRSMAGRDAFSWEHLQLIRDNWPGRLVVKGILRADDAMRIKAMGADGIVVSNHGGRQLDGAAAPLNVLPEIVAAVGEMPVMLDGGVRRGSDVLKALALGARFVFVGRPFVFAAAVAGEAGVRHAAEILRSEIDRNMAMLGINRCDEIDADLLMAQS